MKTTINKLRTELQLLAEANEMLNGFYWKDLLRAQSESVCEYPLMTVHYTTGAIIKNQTRVQLEINICDKIYTDWDENLNDVESDTLNLQRQIFNAMQSVRWKRLGRIESASLKKFIADSKDYVAGHTMTLTFLLRDTDGVCDLPIFNYNFDEVTSADNSVTVFNSDSSYSVVVDCGSSLELPDITYSIENSLGSVVSSATVPSVSNIIDVLPDVDNVDSDGSVVPTPAQVPFVCTIPTRDTTLLGYYDSYDLDSINSGNPTESDLVSGFGTLDGYLSYQQSIGTYMPSIKDVATNPRVLLGDNDWLQLSAAITFQDFDPMSLYFVYEPSATTNANGTFLSSGTLLTGALTTYFWERMTLGYIRVNIGDFEDFTHTRIPVNGVKELISFHRDSSNNVTMYQNGVLMASTGDGVLNGLLTLSQMGGFNTTYKGHYVYNTSIYNVIHDTATREAKELELITKYGITV